MAFYIPKVRPCQHRRGQLIEISGNPNYHPSRMRDNPHMTLGRTDSPFVYDGDDVLVVHSSIMKSAKACLRRLLESLSISEYCDNDMLNRHLRQFEMRAVFFLNRHKASLSDIVGGKVEPYHRHPIFDLDPLDEDMSRLVALWSIIEEGIQAGLNRQAFERAKNNWQTAFSSMSTHGGSW